MESREIVAVASVVVAVGAAVVASVAAAADVVLALAYDDTAVPALVASEARKDMDASKTARRNGEAVA